MLFGCWENGKQNLKQIDKRLLSMREKGAERWHGLLLTKNVKKKTRNFEDFF